MSFELPGLVSCLFHLSGAIEQATDAEAHFSDVGILILAGAVVALFATAVQVALHWRREDGRNTTEGSV